MPNGLWQFFSEYEPLLRNQICIIFLFDWTTFISELYPQKYTGHCVLALWKAHQFEWLQTVEKNDTIGIHSSKCQQNQKQNGKNKIKSKDTHFRCLKGLYLGSDSSAAFAAALVPVSTPGQSNPTEEKANEHLHLHCL